MGIAKIKSGYAPFVVKNKIVAPFTQIENRAYVDDSLKCIFGVDRIICNSINLLPNEFGPNGERVYEDDHADSRVRFVGSGWYTQFDVNGTRPITNVADDFVEVTFYGTSLNVLFFSAAGPRNFGITVDGGAEFNINVQSSSVLYAQFYKLLHKFDVTGNLTEGWHTVKIRNINAGTYIDLFGFEFINENAQIVVKKGQCHANGYEYSIDTDVLLDYDKGFENVLDANVGTSGGRVIIYMDTTTASIKKMLTKVGAPLFLANADHSNESIKVKFNLKDYGRRTSTDFSSIPGSSNISSRNWTMDNASDSLAASGVFSALNNQGEFHIRLTTAGEMIVSFIGSGFDIETVNNNANAKSTIISVDGVDIGTVDNAANETGRKIRICSGLPYGSHTIKFKQSVFDGVFLKNFVIYQPKKPAIPESAIELGEYNLVAQHTQLTDQTRVDTMSTGVIRNLQTRGVRYNGSWSLADNNNILYYGGKVVVSTAASAFCEFEFFGDGIEYRFDSGIGRTENATIDIDGITDFTPYTTSVVGTAVTFNNATGVINMNNSNNEKGCSLVIKGLPLGKHKIKITANSANNVPMGSFDIITPVHFGHHNIGNSSIGDIRSFDSMIDLNKEPKLKETFASVNMVSSSVYSSKGIAQIIKEGSGIWFLFYEDQSVESDQVMFSGGSTNDYKVSWNNKSDQFNDASLSYNAYHTYHSGGTSGDNTGPSTVILKRRLQKDFTDKE